MKFITLAVLMTVFVLSTGQDFFSPVKQKLETILAGDNLGEKCKALVSFLQKWF